MPCSLKSIYITLLFFGSTFLFSQKQDHQWIIGYNLMQPPDTTFGHTMFDFNFDPVKIKYDSIHQIDMAGGNASICDSMGQLLFTTNGQVIYDGENKVVDNKINYDKSRPFSCNEWEYNNAGTENDPIPIGLLLLQRIIILPFNNLYKFMYNTFDYCWEHGYRLLSTDVVTNNNKFVSSNKDNLIISDSIRNEIHSIRHGNGRDWWVINLSKNSNYLYLFHMQEDGVKEIKKIDINPNNRALLGYIAFSPDGKHLAFYMARAFGGVDGGGFGIANFDRCSGEITNIRYKYWMQAGIGSGVEFSSDSHFLYVCDTENIYQYDMQATDVLNSEIRVGKYDGYEYMFPGSNFGYGVNFGSMKCGPDGKIYIFTPSGSQRYMSTIESPTKGSYECNVKQHSIFVPRTFTRTFPNIPNYRLGPLDSSPCDTLGLDNHPIAKFRYDADTLDHLRIGFTDLSYFRPETWTWDFGDGSPISSMRHPVHTFTKNGTYTVCLTVSNENSTNTTCRTITIGTSSTKDDYKIIADINLFPNPVEDLLLITIGNYIPEHGVVQLFDMMGRPVHTQRVFYSHNSIDLTRLKPGTYVWRITDKGHFIKSGKVVKI